MLKIVFRQLAETISEQWMSLKLLRSSYNSQNMNIISEAAVYKLIMRSNKPIALQKGVITLTNTPLIISTNNG